MGLSSGEAKARADKFGLNELLPEQEEALLNDGRLNTLPEELVCCVLMWAMGLGRCVTFATECVIA